MSDLTNEKLARLTAVLASAPDHAAGRLVELFERMNVKGSQVIPGGVLIGALRDAGKIHALTGGKKNVRIPSFDRLFFEPFEGLFENGSVSTMRPGAIARSGLREAWQVILAHFVPAEFSQTKAKATESILKGDLFGAREMAQNMRATVLSKVKGLNPKDIAGLAKNEDAQAFLLRLVPLLLAQACARDTWARLLAKNEAQHESAVGALCGHVSTLFATNPAAASECLLITMSLLQDPSTALKVLNKLGRVANGTGPQEHDFNIACRRLHAIGSQNAALIERATAIGGFQGASAAAAIKAPLQILQGLKRQALSAQDSQLCNQIVESCQIADEHLIAICVRATTHLENTLPMEPVKSYAQASMNKPRLDMPPDMTRVQETVQHLAFVSEAQSLGTLWHFGMERERASKHAARYINDICEHLLRAAHISGGHENYQAWVGSLVSLIQVVQGPNAATVFEKRADAAKN